jgi:anaerobic selenocysteine-containing dehydrogenase
VHPADAARLGLRDGVIAEVSGRTGMIRVPVEVTGEMRPGTVSIPHGWGHDADGLRIAVAQAHPGANSNILTDELVLDEPSGNAVLNGIPVEVRPAAGSNSTSATTCENSR